jgi:cell wall-associated NlpC family hydrolase
MSPLEAGQRAAVVAEAMTWLRTPHHHQAAIKGVGVDCAMLPASVYAAVGCIPPVEFGHYAYQWSLHRKTELYRDKVREYATEIPGLPGPGDLVLFKFGLTFSHGAIVVEWPRIIHAHVREAVVLADASIDGVLLLQADGTPRMREFYTLWPAGRSE